MSKTQNVIKKIKEPVLWQIILAGILYLVPWYVPWHIAGCLGLIIVFLVFLLVFRYPKVEQQFFGGIGLLALILLLLFAGFIKNEEIYQKQYLLQKNGFNEAKVFAQEELHLLVAMQLPSIFESYLQLYSFNPNAQIRNGLCLVTIYPDAELIQNLLDKTQQIGLKEVSLHEIGHCVDFYWNRAESIAPMDRKEALDDGQLFLDAERKTTTKRWREIFADLFLVGYLRIYETKDQADKKIEALIRWRKLRGINDHTTDCWVEESKKYSTPKTPTEIVSWAHQIRSSANCELAFKEK